MGTSLSKTYVHLIEDAQKGVDDEGPYWVARYKFDDWADSDDIANELVGAVSYVGTTVVRNTPHQHPLSPNTFCRSVRIIGLGNPVLNSEGLPNYDGGFLAEVVYRPGTWAGIAFDPEHVNQIDPEDPLLWCTQELDYEVEAIVAPRRSYQWLSDGKKADVPVKIEVGVTTMVLTFHRTPYLPMKLVRQKRGKINDDVFLGAPKGTVRFRGARTTRDVATDGSLVQRVQLVFQERDKPWNQFLRPDRLVWDDLVDDVGNDVYEETDLSPLLRL